MRLRFANATLSGSWPTAAASVKGFGWFRLLAAPRARGGGGQRTTGAMQQLAAATAGLS